MPLIEPGKRGWKNVKCTDTGELSLTEDLDDRLNLATKWLIGSHCVRFHNTVFIPWKS